jgi:O-acetyl-ADP-ribose deacetylase (regulator of RNase III)
VSFQFMQTRVEIVQEGAEWPDADGLLLPTNDFLWMAAGPALSVKQKAGEVVEIEAVRLGPVSLGEVVTTGAGALPYRGILHAAVMGQNLQISKEAARKAIRAGVVAACDHNWSRLLVHSLLATGRGTHRDLARPVLSDLVDQLLDGGSLRLVTLLAIDTPERDVLHDALLQIIQEHE